MIRARGITILAGRKRLLSGVDATIPPGRVTALIGPNGAGKSTLISVLAGERRPDEGEVSLEAAPLAHAPQRELAQRRAVLLQNTVLDFAFTAEEVVELGRLPHSGTMRQLDDETAVAAACRLTGIDEFRNRSYQTLSGGEKQRVQFARAIAQIWRRPGEADAGPRYLLLDEPTSALDLRHQRAVLDVARRLADEGVGVLAAIHDLNLASAYADDVILLRDGSVLASGPAEEILTGDKLGACFDVKIEILTRENGARAILA
ncbi:ABC transporter related [Parvibaculum lavamentivorans DS-1]|uniref:ABC transporter related n=1 Tax=Parvibaculum lavamentivorans (strain DS-1 / DSM 13023 / NCIMB 13966) TaxID=402881 RepID=A7HPH0_PARL1|nr:heme ABC transporter ATP-binding protein [Parvibaculum lavamentivorans]ABS61803.1 ABC transporter related [Parvibaculum lavamentivorans DS-1]